MSAKKPAIIYIKRDRLDYWNNENPHPLTFLFPPDQVKDMEVLNPTAFEISLQSFIETSRITPCKIIIILSDQVYFEKQIPDNIATFEKDDFINSFLDIVPFDNVTKRTIRHDNHSFIVCVNSDIWGAIKTTFTRQGSMVTTILPSFAFGIAELKSGFDPTLAKTIVSKAENYKEANFLDTAGNTTASASPKSSKPNNHVRELILGFVFLALLSVLVILVIVQKPFSPPPSQPIILPTVTPLPALEATPQVKGIMDEKNYSVIITTSRTKEALADRLLTELLQKGYKEIRIEFSASNIQQSKITIPADMSPIKRDTLIRLLKTSGLSFYLAQAGTPYIHLEL